MSAWEASLTIASIIISLIAAHFYYTRQRVRKLLNYSHEHFDLLTPHSSAFSDVRVLKGDRAIDRPKKIYLYIWNAGNSEITDKDVPAGAPLTVTLKGAEIVEAAISKSTKAAAGAKLQQEGDSLKLVYEYLNPGDGIAIELLVSTGHDFTIGKGLVVTADLKGAVSGLRLVTHTTGSEKRVS